MNYQKIYNQIVERAQSENRKKLRRDQEGYVYFENHHITPKSLNGGNEKENLVLLTAREHFLCHWLLVRIHPKNKRLVFAFWCMCTAKSGVQQNRYKPSSRLYRETREQVALLQSQRTISEESRRRMSESQCLCIRDYSKGIETKRRNGTLKHTQESKDKISKIQKNRPLSEDHRKKLSIANTPEVIKKRIETTRQNGGFTREARQIEKMLETRLRRRGTVSTITPESIERTIRTRESRTQEEKDKSVAKGRETRLKNGTVTKPPQSTPQSLQKAKETRIKNGTNKLSEGTKQKIRESSKRRIESLTEEDRVKFRSFLGKTHTDKVRSVLSEKSKLRESLRTTEEKERISQKISESLKLRNLNKKLLSNE